MVKLETLQDFADYHFVWELRLKKPETKAKLNENQYAEMKQNLGEVWELCQKLVANQNNHALVDEINMLINKNQYIITSAGI